MTRPVDARDALRKAVENQQIQRASIREEAQRIADERAAQAARETQTEETQ